MVTTVPDPCAADQQVDQRQRGDDLDVDAQWELRRLLSDDAEHEEVAFDGEPENQRDLAEIEILG